MKIIDTHSHLYLSEFNTDLSDVIDRAKTQGLEYILLPNVDSTTCDAMLSVCHEYEGYCFPMIGVHPTSINADYKKELDFVQQQLTQSNNYIAIGEVGLDLYWDATYIKEQLIAFDYQIQLALQYGLPLVIHCRNAFDELYEAMKPYVDSSLSGVFHSFAGTPADVERLLEFEQFMFGFNGVVTYKKSHLPDVIKLIPMSRIVLETDAPYLPPVPYRGKRNESSYIKYTLLKVAEVFNVDPEFLAEQTTLNAIKLFRLQ